MSFKDDIDSATTRLLYTPFDSRRGYVVPTTDTIALGDGAVGMKATFMYTDMAGSTELVRTHPDEVSARVIRAFLTTVVKTMTKRGGQIRSFDGDRVMSIFAGDDGPTQASIAAREIKWLLDEVVQPNINLFLPTIRSSGWTLKCGTGIDVGEAFIVRGGVRGDNDLVSVGDAPNIAAKLSEQRSHTTWITDRMWEAMSYESCFTTDRKPIWSNSEWMSLGSRWVQVRHSDWRMVVS